MRQHLTGLLVLAFLLSHAASAQFSGGMGSPAGIMGAGAGFGSTGGDRGPRKAQWRPWLSVGGNYTSSVNYLEDDGTVKGGPGAYGGAAGWGISGIKSLEDTSMILAYAGRTALYNNNAGTQGMSHVFNAGVTHRFNQKLYGAFQQMLGTSLGGYGNGSRFAGLGGLSRFGSTFNIPLNGLLGFQDPFVNGLVDDEIFDNRVNFSSSFGSVSYRLNMRSSIGGGVGAHFVRRNSNALADTDLISGSANYSYLLSQSTQVGVGYSYGLSRYPNRLGDNRFQTLMLFASKALSRRMSISGSGGAVLLKSNFVGVVALDPELAELLGVAATTTVQDASRLTFSGSAGFNFHDDFINFSAFAGRSVVPGNGILFGGIRDVVSVTAGRSLFRDVISGSLSAAVSRISGIVQSEEQIRYMAQGSLGRALGAGFHLGVSGGLRWQQLTKGGPYLPQKFVSVGISWSPGDYPLFF